MRDSKVYVEGIGPGRACYYAYGSNLAMNCLKRLCPSLVFITRADLPNYEVQFRHYSENRQGGTSCIIEAPGKMVRGVIYSIAEEDMAALDDLESVELGIYKREMFLVLGEDHKWYEADLYRLVNPTGPYPASKSYVDEMIEGAHFHGLDQDYTARLEALRRSLD